MTLDNFRTQKIIWDRANKKIFEAIEASSGDSNGRKLVVQVINQETTESLSGTTLSLGWKSRNGAKGLDAFDVVDASKGIFEIYYTTEMLSNIGNIEASLILIDSTSRIESSTFTISVRPSTVDDESIESENSFTALTEALVKVNDFDARLAQKADYDTTWSMGNMGQDVKEAMTGGSVAVVGEGSVNQPNINPNQVTEYETSFIKKNKNLFNKKNIINGYLLNSQDGVTLNEDSSWSTSKEFIRVIPNSTLYKNKVGGYVLFDSSFNRISSKGNGTGSTTIPIPENVYFIKVNLLNVDIGSYQLEYGEVETEYEEGRIWFDEKIGLSGASLERESIEINKMTGFESSKNILNPRRIINGAYVNRTNGEFISNQNNFAYKGIAIPVGADKLRVGEFDEGSVNYAIRDMNGYYIAGGQILPSNSNKVFNVPKGAVSIDISFEKNQVGKAMLSVGEEQVAYDDYYKFFTDIVNRNSGNDGIQQGTHLTGKKIVCFGDSITGSYSSPTDYPSFLAERLGATAYNVGFSGGRMSNRGNEYDFFSMVGIVDAIIANDFTSQDSNDGLNSNWKEKLETLKGIDFSDIDIVTIFYGTNDYNSTVGSLDNELDLFDTTTVLGAARYAIRELQQTFPHLMIVLCSTTWRTNGEGFADDEEVGRIGVTMSELVEGLKSVSDYHHVPFIDMYNGLGINRYNFEEYLLDGLHPNPKGRKLIGGRMASQLLANI